MTKRALIVTCSEPDATPFLAAQPRRDLACTLLLSTRNVIAVADRETPVLETHLLGGPATFNEARRALSGDVHITVVVAPDPWGPLKGKGFVRARQVLPFILPDIPIDIIELEPGGVSGRTRRMVSLRALSRWIRWRESILLAEWILRAGVAAPVRGLERSVGSALPSISSPAVPLPLAIARLLAMPPLAAVTLTRCLAYVVRTEARARRQGPGRDGASC